MNPLHGIVVADFSRVLAGPLCTQLLGDAGALVVAFRAFAAKDPRDKDFRGTLLVGGVIAFVLLCCVALMFISLR